MFLSLMLGVWEPASAFAQTPEIATPGLRFTGLGGTPAVTVATPALRFTGLGGTPAVTVATPALRFTGLGGTPAVTVTTPALRFTGLGGTPAVTVATPALRFTGLGGTPTAVEEERAAARVRRTALDLVSVKLLRVIKKGGKAGDNTLPFLLSDVEEVIGGIASATCLVPATVPAGGFVSDVAIDIDAVTAACRVSTNIGTATEAIRITREGAASAQVTGRNGWVASIALLIDATPTVFTATLGGTAFEIDATLTVDAGTLDIRVAVADLRRR